MRFSLFVIYYTYRQRSGVDYDHFTGRTMAGHKYALDITETKLYNENGQKVLEFDNNFIR